MCVVVKVHQLRVDLHGLPLSNNTYWTGSSPLMKLFDSERRVCVLVLYPIVFGPALWRIGSYSGAQ